MPNRQSIPRWVASALVFFGVIVGACGIFTVGFIDFCMVELAGPGNSGRLFETLPLMLMLEFGGPLILIGGMMIFGGIAMRRNPPP